MTIVIGISSDFPNRICLGISSDYRGPETTNKMLDSILIDNYKSCRATRIQFGRSLTGLVGMNGAGKSNILQFIHWLSRSITAPAPIELISISRWDLEARVHAILRLTLRDRTYSYAIALPPAITVGRKRPGIITERLMVVGENRQRWDIFSRRGELVRIKGKPKPLRVARDISSLAALASLLTKQDEAQADILSVRDFLAGISYYPTAQPAERSDTVTEASYKDWIWRLNRGEVQPGSILLKITHMFLKEKSLFNELISLFGPKGLGLLGGLRVAELDEPSGTAEVARKEAETSIPDYIYVPIFAPSPTVGGYGRAFTMSALSEGTRRVISIITSLLFDKRSLMLMEQPEDSMHPGLLRQLIGILRTYSLQSQIVFTTHSADALNRLETGEVRLVAAEKGRTVVRGLSAKETSLAEEYLRDEGSLYDFLGLIGE